MNDEASDSHFRYCPSCGLDSGKSDQFCRSCGTSLASTISAPVPQDKSESSTARRGRSARARRRVRIAAGLACLVVAAGAAVAITTLAVPGKPSFKFSAADAENLTWRLSHIPLPPDSRIPLPDHSACHVPLPHSALPWVPVSTMTQRPPPITSCRLLNGSTDRDGRWRPFGRRTLLPKSGNFQKTS
jgi:hypothetical protein